MALSGLGKSRVAPSVKGIGFAVLVGGMVTTQGCGDAEDQARSAICAELENLSPQDMKKFYDIAKVELGKAGIKVDASMWNDPQKFQSYVNAFADAAQCPELRASGVNTNTSALHKGGAEDYCGPGHGDWVPEVAPCLNEACKEHDSCYARCSGEASGFTCSWSEPTRPCDDVMLAKGYACPFPWGTKLKSWMVMFIAQELCNPSTGGVS